MMVHIGNSDHQYNLITTMECKVITKMPYKDMFNHITIFVARFSFTPTILFTIRDERSSFFDPTHNC